MYMQAQTLRHAGKDFIKQDLRRLKTIKSLPADLESIFDIVCGLVSETGWPPNYDFCGGIITQFKVDGEEFICFKERVPTANPLLSPANGCRIIYALGISSMTFVPLLVYRANEEGCDYKINGKKFKLTSSSLSKIINEKMK